MMKDVSKLERDPHTKLSNEKVVDNIKIQLELELSTSIFKNVHQKAIEENEKSFNANFNSFKYEKAFRAKKVQSQEIADSCGYYKDYYYHLNQWIAHLRNIHKDLTNVI